MLEAVKPPPVCPKCGRAVHAVPGPDGPRPMAALFEGRGVWRLVPHVCLPAQARWPWQPIAETDYCGLFARPDGSLQA